MPTNETYFDRALRQRWMRATLIALALVAVSLPLGMPLINLIIWVPMAPIAALAMIITKDMLGGVC